MSRNGAANTAESTPMAKWLLLPMLVLAYIATSATAAAPPDRDHDRLPDRWERKHRLSTAIPSAMRDPDVDHLTNRRERRLHTHPRRADTDRDGLRDGAEVRRFHTNPRKRDTDGDGLSDRREVRRLHTNPRKRDTDGDGFGDRVELRAGTDPRDRRSHPRRGGSVPPQTPGNPTPSPASGFPNRRTTGVPDGWVPARTRSTDLTINTAGAVVEDVLLSDGADLLVNAPDVTIRRVKLQGGVINNWPSGTCRTGMVIEDTTLEPIAGQPFERSDVPAIAWGAYTARRVEIVNRGEGPRVADCAEGALGRVTVEDSFIFIKGDEFGTPWCINDSHSDGTQAVHGRGADFRNNTIIFANACGTSPYFMGYGGTNPNVPTVNTGTYNVHRLLIGGGGAVFRQQVPGSITGLRIINNSWWHFPIDNRCSVLKPWEAKIVEVDAQAVKGGVPNPDADYRVTSVVRDQPCNTEVVE
jgi:Bacterial TSP3 repeat